MRSMRFLPSVIGCFFLICAPATAQTTLSDLSETLVEQGVDESDAAQLETLAKSAADLGASAIQRSRASPNPFAPIIDALNNSPEITTTLLLLRVRSEIRRAHLDPLDGDPVKRAERLRILTELESRLVQVIEKQNASPAPPSTAAELGDVAGAPDTVCADETSSEAAPQAPAQPVDTERCIRPGETADDAICRLECRPAKRLLDAQEILLAAYRKDYAEKLETRNQAIVEELAVTADLEAERATLESWRSELDGLSEKLTRAQASDERMSLAGQIADVTRDIELAVARIEDRERALVRVRQRADDAGYWAERYRGYADMEQTQYQALRRSYDSCLRRCVAERLEDGGEIEALDAHRPDLLDGYWKSDTGSTFLLTSLGSDFWLLYESPSTRSRDTFGWRAGDLSLEGSLFGRDVSGTVFLHFPLDMKEACGSLWAHSSRISGSLSRDGDTLTYTREIVTRGREDCEFRSRHMETVHLRRVEK